MILLLASPAAAQWSTQSPAPTFLDVRGVGAPTAQRVFVATNDDSFDDGGALFESEDGGSTWVQRAVPFSLSDPLNGIFFLDSQNGWTFGNANYRTTDGGTTWINQVSGTGHLLTSVSLIDANTATVVGDDGTILRTTDGGVT